MVHQLRRSLVFGRGLAIAAEPVPVFAEEQIVHSHDFLELVVVRGGEGTHRSITGEQRLGRGSLAVVRPGDWHSYERCRGLDVWNLYIGVEVFTQQLALLGHVVQTNNLWTLDRAGRNAGATLSVLDADALARVERWLEDLHGTGPDGGGSPALRLGLLLCVLGTCVPGASGPEAAPATSPAVVEAVRLLEADIRAPWTLHTLCEAVHVSPSYLSRRFATAVGAPPIAYVNRLRAERAAAMLLDSDRSVSSIGESVGWPDPNYASRRFRAAFGLSPAEYRRTLRSPIAGQAGIGPAAPSGPDRSRRPGRR